MGRQPGGSTRPRARVGRGALDPGPYIRLWLQGNLLFVHGTGEDNCHYRGSGALINEFVAHDKQFSLMAYPNRTHSIREGRGTTRHLHGTLTRFLTKQMPPDTGTTDSGGPGPGRGRRSRIDQHENQ